MSDARELKLREFFETYYLPRKLENPAGQNSNNYRRALDYWEKLTANLTLAELDGNHAAVSAFKAALAAATSCRSCLEESPYLHQRRRTVINCGCPKARPLGRNTQVSWLTHVQMVLRFAGPPYPRHEDNANVIKEIPYTRPPKSYGRIKEAVQLDDLKQLFAVCDEAQFPQVDWATPGQIWRAWFAVMRCTALRFSQMARLTWASVNLQRRLILLPAELCPKGKRDECKTLTQHAVQLLLPLRGPRELVFPEAMATQRRRCYLEWERLAKAAGVAVVKGVKFHGIRRRAITELGQISPTYAQLAGGHSAFGTTQLYLQVEELGRAVDELPPLDDATG